MAVKRGRREAPRMGKPPKPAEEVRRNRLVIMVTDAELDAIQALAARRGVPQGTVAHEVLLRALRRRD